jgi:hypothetical protein
MLLLKLWYAVESVLQFIVLVMLMLRLSSGWFERSYDRLMLVLILMLFSERSPCHHQRATVFVLWPFDFFGIVGWIPVTRLLLFHRLFEDWVKTT